MSTAYQLEVISSRPQTKATQAGAEKHPPLLFVHGSYCGAWIWSEHFMPFFSEQGYECHAVSLRGHGGSEGHERIDYHTLEDYVTDVLEVADRFETPPVVIGHSMGGMVVQKYLERRQAPASVFMCSVPPQGLGVSAMHMATAAPDLFFQLGLISAFGEEWASPMSLVKHLFSGHVTPELAERYIPLFQRESRTAALDLMQLHYPRLKREAFPPTLVIGGTKDQFVPIWALEMSAHAYGADLEVIKGAAHVLMLDPEWWKKTAETMIAWMRKKKI